MKPRRQHQRVESGLTLVEMVVAAGVGSLVLVAVGMLSIYALRSFNTIGNHTILDAQNRLALDKITRDLHGAVLAARPYSDSTVTRLVFTNAVGGETFKYLYYPAERKVICERAGRDEVYLTECDGWDFKFFRRTPVPNAPNTFSGATNAAGGVEVNDCKLVELSWKCSRDLFGKNLKTETVQRARVMLRNAN